MNTPPRKQTEAGLYAPVWREFNKLVDYVREISITGGRNVRVNRSMNGTTVVGVPEARQEEAGSQIQRMTIISVSDDYITCQKQDETGTAYGDNILVAKPRHLRVTTWNGITFGSWRYNGDSTSRVLTYVGTPITGGFQTGDTISETLDPSWSGSEIFATEAEGETGVTVNGTRLTYIDLNVDARRYITARALIEVCRTVNGVQEQRRLVLDGGPII